MQVVNLAKERFTFPKETLEDICPGTGGVVEYREKRPVYTRRRQENFLLCL